MRELKIGTKRFTRVVVADEPSEGGACHEYYISRSDGREDTPEEQLEFGHIHFQKGPIKENGVNGCHNEDLLAIVIDRLQHFQAGKFKCRENALALTKLEECMHWLNHRTQERIRRGVDGTHQP